MPYVILPRLLLLSDFTKERFIMSKKYDVLTYRIPIIKPVSTDWKTFGKISGNLIYSAIRLMNEAIRMHYVNIQEKYEYEQEHGRISARDWCIERYNAATFSTHINRTLKTREESEDIPGDLVELIARQAVDTFNTNSREVLANNASLPTFRRDQPIPVRARSLGITEDYTCFLPFMTRELAKEYGFKGRRMQSFEVQLGTQGDAKTILDRILEGTYKACDSKVQRTKDGKWFLLLTYKQPRKERNLDVDKIMGIDLGIVKAATIAIAGERKVYEIDGGEIAAFRRRIEGRRNSIRRQLPVASRNRRGHGRKTLLKPLETLSRKVENFKDTVNHRYSRYIVDLAVKRGAGTIQMEDLSGINKRSSFLATWSYFDLQEKIRYKAEMEGIKFVKVPPRYTSQRCFHCGVINEGNRQTQASFECTSCGHRRNADYNAAENLTLKDIDKIIDEQLKYQRKATA